jgi:integrase
MVESVMRRAPKYVQSFVDNRGAARFYFRRPGFPRVALPGLPWSPEFMRAYEAAKGNAASPIGEHKTIPGSLRALAASYYQSVAFAELSEVTKASYRRIIDCMCKEHGHLRVATLKRKDVINAIERRKDTPGMANAFRNVLRVLMQRAIEVGLRADDPTAGIKPLRPKNPDGYHCWTEEEIEGFKQRWPVGTKQRLALALLLNTGQRRSDAVRLGRQHIRDGLLSLRQDKTGNDVFGVPILPELAEALAGVPADNLTFITTPRGTPYTPGSFSHWFKDQCRAANLPHCSAHGLRKACATRLADAGCTPHEIAAITGHGSLKEVERYTRAANQKKLAAAAVAKVRTSIVKQPLSA